LLDEYKKRSLPRQRSREDLLVRRPSLTPWYNEHTCALKRAARKMERSWRKTKLEVFRMAWRKSTLSYRKALKTARSDYFSSLLEENKHNPRYLFNTVAKLKKNKTSTGVDISQQHSSNDFMNYFTFKINLLPLLFCSQRRRSHFFSPRPHPYLPCFAPLSRIERLSLHCSPN